MFLQLTCLTILLNAFVQVNSVPFFGNYQYDANVEPSKLGDILRAKAQFVDKVKSRILGHFNSQQGGANVGGSSTRGFTAGGSSTGSFTTGGSGSGGFNVGVSSTGRSGALSQNLNQFGESLSSSLDATGRFIDSGIAAGKEYGRTVFLGATIVPKTLHDLVTAHHQNNAKLSVNVAQDLSYVTGERPDYLFQFVDFDSNIIPVTAEVAHKLVPGLII